MIKEEDVTEFRNEGVKECVPLPKTKMAISWFNTEYRYSVYDSIKLKNNKFYTRHKSIRGLDRKKDSNLEGYPLTVRDDNNNLWFVPYRSGVWKYDGTKITNYEVSRLFKRHNFIQNF